MSHRRRLLVLLPLLLLALGLLTLLVLLPPFEGATRCAACRGTGTVSYRLLDGGAETAVCPICGGDGLARRTEP